MAPYKRATIEYNPVCDPKYTHGYHHVRWVENASDGLRFVGFADEIVKSINHRGWFTVDDDAFADETYRGVVYQLPAGKGFAYGYADPDNKNCALLCFDLEASKEDAARSADRFAELYAEEARDFNRAWQAGRRVESLADEIKEARREALTIGAEMREAKKRGVQAPTICATLRAEVLRLYRRIQKMRKEREELVCDFGTSPGFVE